MIVLLLFFCSGATALVYEVVWSKYLSLMLGSSVQAQTVVLAAFMGGLALGNRWFGPVADRSRQPLRLYGYLELAIGAYAFGFETIFRGADWLFLALGSGVVERGGGLLWLKALMGAGLLLGPTILMGGTLPLLAGWLQRRYTDAGRWSARFYSVNSLGAVAGSALAGFFLIRHVGMVSTLHFTAIANVLVGFAALALARRQGEDVLPAAEPAEGATRESQAGGGSQARRLLLAACILVSVTGGVSMGLEVLAARSLVLMVGASLQAFALVLIAFILGIGLGSAVVASPRFRQVPWAVTVIGLLLGAAVWVGMLVIGIEQWVTVYRHLKTGLGRTAMGYHFHQVLIALLSLVVLGVPAAMIGAVLPVSLRALGGGGELGRQVGRLLTWNTLGAVVGSLLTGFVLMPWLGLRSAFLVHVVLLCGAAVVLGWSLQRRLAVVAAVVVAVALGTAASVTGDHWRHVFSSGIFRLRETEVIAEVMEQRRETVKLLFYEDAADATVSVEEDRSSTPPILALRVNGKPDASDGDDLGTQYLAGHLPLLLRPDAREVFVLGLGSGATAGAVLHHPVDRVVIAENCEPVLRAAEHFKSINNGVLTNSRAHIVFDDGRTVLKMSPRPYDLIINEPSNPWMVGVGSVFSREYYELCRDRLKPDGLVVQWFHVYEMNDEIVGLVLRTFATVFPHMEIWDATVGDLLLVGSLQPWNTGTNLFRAAFHRPAVRQQLEQLGLTTPESIWVRQLASQRTAHAVGGFGPIQTDNFPQLEYDAPQAFFTGERSRFLLRFDERLWQAAFAPEEKRLVLQSMPDDLVRRVFATYRSTIPDVADHLLSHRPRGNPTNNHPFPCIFRPEEWAATPVGMSADMPPEDRRVLEVTARLRRPSSTWREDVQFLVQALQSRPPEKAPGSPKWNSSMVARDAATTALVHGDFALAQEVLAAGLSVEPGAAELQYMLILSRRWAAEKAGG